MLQVNASLVLRYEGDGTATIVGRHNRDNIEVFHVGERLPAVEHSAFARVLATGAPARIDDWGGLTGEVAEAIFRTGYRSTAAAPIVVAGTLWGAVAIASEDALPPESEERLARVLRARLAGGRERPGSRRPDRLARAARQGRRRAAPPARAQPARRRPAALRLRRAQAARWRGRGWPRIPRPRRTCSRTPRASSTPRCRSCARSPAGCIRRSSATSGCAARWTRSPSASPIPVDIDAADERLPEARRGDGLLHRLRGSHQRRQARGGDPRARLGPPRWRRPALRGRRRRPGRRGHDERDRHPRPARSGRGSRGHAVAGQPARARDGGRGGAAADRRLTPLTPHGASRKGTTAGTSPGRRRCRSGWCPGRTASRAVGRPEPSQPASRRPPPRSA